MSQSNPLKAAAEFVENSIDAHARNITITRGKERGQHYLGIVDDGDGVPRDEAGVPDFKFVATHICDPIKRRMKESGAATSSEHRGLPGYTYQKAPGELWRSRYDAQQNVIIINNGHRDFVYASRNKTLKLRYLCRLFAKELVVKNFPGYSADQLLERMIELGLYTEEHLR